MNVVYIKYLISILFTCFVVSCAHPSADGIRNSNSIVLICDKDKVYADTIYLTRDIEGPVVCATEAHVFNFYNELFEEIDAGSCIRTDTIPIYSQARFQILRYRYNPLEFVDFLVKNGDTVLIDNNSHTPRITLKNRAAWGVNYDWERERRYGRMYGYNPETLIKAEPTFFLMSLLDKFDFDDAKNKLHKTLQNNNKDELCWLDSLYRVRLLDSVEYQYFKSRNHFQGLDMELEHKTKSELHGILSKYSDSTYIADFYLFYRNYYDRVVRKYYFNEQPRMSNDYKAIFERISQDTLLTGLLRDKYIYHCFQNIDAKYSVIEGKRYYDKAIKVLRDTATINLLHNKYDTLYRNEIVFDDDLKTRDTEGRIKTLSAILAANSGKVVYVDFWASWCAPCMSEMPASKKLRDEYRGKEVVFIYLAFNDKEENWKNALDRAELSDLQHVYLVTNPRTSSFVDKLKLKTIPRYLIYDKDGRLVNADAPRPGSKEIRSELNKYLH